MKPILSYKKIEDFLWFEFESMKNLNKDIDLNSKKLISLEIYLRL